MYIVENGKYVELGTPFLVENGKYVELGTPFVVENGKYVELVGGSGYVLASYNYSNSADGKGTVIYKTEDGLTWNRLTTLANVDFFDIAYGKGKLVAVSQSTKEIYYSEDGATWTKAITTSIGLHCVCYNHHQGKFVAVGTIVLNSSGSSDGDIYVYSSTDGINWTQVVADTNKGTYYNNWNYRWYQHRLIYTENFYVYTQGYNYWYSYDGITWENKSISSNTIQGVTCNDADGKCAMITRYNYSGSSSYTDRIFTFTDPSAVTQQASLGSASTSSYIGDIEYGDKYIAQLYQNYISEDGKTFTQSGQCAFSVYGSYLSQLKWLFGKYFAIPNYLTSSYYTNGRVHMSYSHDGASWTVFDVGTDAPKLTSSPGIAISVLCASTEDGKINL